MKHLSYSTLYSMEEMLKKEIALEKHALNLLNYSDGKLQRLQEDLHIIKKAIAEKNTFYSKLSKVKPTK